MSQGLDRRELFVPLGIGLGTDVDPKLLPVGKVTQMENLLWTPQAGDQAGTKRPGYAAMPNNYVTSGTPAALPVPWQFAQHKGTTLSLGVAGPRPIAAYAPSLSKWMVPPVAVADGANGIACKLRGQVIATRQTVDRSDTTTGFVATNQQVDVATDGTLALVAWTHVVPGGTQLLAKFMELSTGRVLFAYNLATGAGGIAVPQAIYTNGIFTLAWIDLGAGNINEVHWSASAVESGTAAPSAVVAVVTGFTSSGIGISAAAHGNNIALLYNISAVVKMSVYAAGVPGAVTTTTMKDSASTPIPLGSAAWVSDLGGSGRIDIVVANAGGLQYFLNVGGGTASGEVNVDATSYTFGVPALAAHTTSASATGEFAIVYQTPGSSTLNLGWRTNAHGASSKVWFNDDAHVLLSKTFAHGGDFYALIGYQSQTQGTHFVIRVPVLPSDPADYTQAPSARFCSEKGENFFGSLTSVVPLSGSQLVAGTIVRTRELVTPGGTIFDSGVDLVTITFDPVTGTSREYADSTYVCGGLLGAFDGQTFAEEAFHVFPEDPVVTQTSGGSMTLLGTYLVCSVFKYIDANGRVHRSAPSNPVSVTLTGPNRSISIVQNTLKLTGRPGQVAIEFYRVKNAGDTQLTLSLLKVIANDETADTVNTTDGSSDASMATAMPIYTTGGVLENGPPVTPLALAVYNQQLAAVLADDPTLIQISLPLTDFDGEGWPIFDNAQVSAVRIEDAHGPLVGLAGMDDKLLAFKADAVYALAGQGPDITGNGSWPVPAFVCIGTGCSQPRSILETPDGVIFRSTSGRAGYYLVNRGLSLEYIGAPAQAYLGDTIVDAVYVASKSRAMFFTAQGRTHVYDQALSAKVGQPMWTTFTSQAAAAAGLFNGLPIYQQAGQTAFSVLAEDATGSVWDENGTPNDEYVVTPWLSLASLKGYLRFYKVQGLGQTIAAHLLTVTMWVDFNDAAPFAQQSIQIGGPGPTADWNAWRFQFPTKRTAVRFGIRCARTTGDRTDSAAANISGIVIEYGVKTGLRKVPAANTTT